ncbi:retropepsin-like aspartic protease [Aspergillus undulatus]|uniref:retropepsin-like aspartic protease n=1 Tax=Aspergillus undulatus TaxID=1810928 RepID=UPI003CCD2AC2
MPPHAFLRHDYEIGFIASLPAERDAAAAMLDRTPDNIRLGDVVVGRPNVVILPPRASKAKDNILRTILGIPEPTHEVKRTEYVTSGFINNILIDGFPDTGSCVNAISAEFLQRQGWTFRRRPNLPKVKLPGNRSIRPLGTIRLPWTFRGEDYTYNVSFYVLQKCVHPVILGRRFLMSSKTLQMNLLRRIQKKEVKPTVLKCPFLIHEE